MVIFPLGALLNGEYCLPCNAEKGLDYICPQCKASVIIRKGDINKHHFSHKPGKRDCRFYDHPGEGEIHRMAKYIFADLLNKRKIKNIERFCPNKYLCLSHACGWLGFPPNQTVDEQIKYDEGDEVVVEHRVNDKCIVDVAVINNGTLKYVFEICDTHKTTRETPEPWFEIDANKFLKDTENGTKLTKDVEYDLDIGDMNILQVVEELCERGSDLGGTFDEKCLRLDNDRHNSEYVHCIRRGEFCPSCKIHISDFTATAHQKGDERTARLKQAIINSKEYEECYPELGAIKSIHDYKGELLVYVNARRYEGAPGFIRRKFKDMLLREWSSESEHLLAICATTHLPPRMCDTYLFYSDWDEHVREASFL